MEPQTLQVTFEFKVQHSPGNEGHLLEILRNHLRGKGITLDDDNKIRV